MQATELGLALLCSPQTGARPDWGIYEGKEFNLHPRCFKPNTLFRNSNYYITFYSNVNVTHGTETKQITLYKQAN